MGIAITILNELSYRLMRFRQALRENKQGAASLLAAVSLIGLLIAFLGRRKHTEKNIILK